jgi:integrase
MMFRSGCRVSDLVAIDLHHLVRDERGVIVACRIGGDDGTHTKTGHARLVPVHLETPALLERYLRRRGKAPGPLFLGRIPHCVDPTGRLSSKAIQQVVNRAARRCGIVLSAHDMRRGWTVDSRRRGVDNLSIRTVAGWSSDRMLARYFGPEAQRLAVDAFHAAADPPVQRLRSV